MNNPTDTNQATEVKRNSLNKSDEDVKFNADDELREKIDEYLSHFEVSVDGIGDVGLFDLVHPRIKDKHGHGVEWAIVISDRIMEAVLADRKKHELQARIDALIKVDADDDGHAWYVDGEVEMRLDEYVSNLIKEYKGE